jgi:hypothetical protein
MKTESFDEMLQGGCEHGHACGVDLFSTVE